MIGKALAYINLVIGIAVIIWTALQLVQKRKSSLQYYIAFLYSMMGYVLLYFWAFRSGVIYFCPGMIYSNIPVVFAIGPAAYLYVTRLIGINDKLTRKSLLHFIPAILSVILIFLFHPANDFSIEFFSTYRPGFPVKETLFISLLDTVANVMVGLYLLLAAIRVYVLSNARCFKSITQLRVIFYLLLAVSLSYLSVTYAHFINSTTLLIYSSVINGSLIVVCFLFSHRNPETTQMVIREAKAARNADSLLGNIDVAGIVGRLMELVDIDKIYRDPEISIQSLSILLEINTYQLSIILNEKMNMNFRAFINFYRLREAQQLLTLEPGKTILEIAFEVGFNSKTSFNTLFSKETGLSPREYRKKFVKK